MKVKYVEDTDTLYIELRPAQIAETKDLDENTLLDLDAEGNICGITIEHAKERTDIPSFSYEQIAAKKFARVLRRRGRYSAALTPIPARISSPSAAPGHFLQY